MRRLKNHIADYLWDNYRDKSHWNSKDGFVYQFGGWIVKSRIGEWPRISRA